ncbi:MAG: aminotransferase class V-fold PLP-dependent enzyme [Alphaproteobacteria bacterium]|nr:aminotransferase class V-fold PLP-dependent enzyme [Alphaproteobacteria bacterium]
MTLDISRARAETPGCDYVLHFNNAGAGLPPAPVLNAVKDHLDAEALGGGYEAAAAARDRVERTYAAAAELLNCAPDEIAVVENATRAWDMAFYSFRFAQGDRILTAEAEYASNYIAYLQTARATGATVEAIPSDEHGQVSASALAEMLDDRVKLIAITHVPTNGGLVNPAAAIGRMARDAGIPFLLDACQSVGQMPVDVEAIGCDILSATGRKYLRGPRGTGLLYVRHALIEKLEPPFLDLHAAEWTAADTYAIRNDARRFETWEGSVAGKIGLGVALDYALDWGLEAIYERVTGLADALRAGLADIPGITVRDLGAEQCGIVTFTRDGTDPTEIQRALSAQKINIAVSPRNFTRLDMDARDLDALARASVHYYNTEDEVARFCAAVAAVD